MELPLHLGGCVQKVVLTILRPDFVIRFTYYAPEAHLDGLFTGYIHMVTNHSKNVALSVQKKTLNDLNYLSPVGLLTICCHFIDILSTTEVNVL